MAKFFLSLFLLSAAAQSTWAFLAEGHLLALPVVAVMLYESARNMRKFNEFRQERPGSPPAGRGGVIR